MYLTIAGNYKTTKLPQLKCCWFFQLVVKAKPLKNKEKEVVYVKPTGSAVTFTPRPEVQPPSATTVNPTAPSSPAKVTVV